MKRTKTAGQTRKSHKSRKTTPKAEPVKGPSSLALTTTAKSPASTTENPIALVLTKPTDAKDEPQGAGIGTGLMESEPKKQWWYRPADSKARKLVEKIMVMRAAGNHDADIAKRLKTTEASVRQYVYMARKNGWLDDHDEPVDLEAELALTVDRKVVRNIDAALDGQMTNWQTHEMTMAAAKGRGIFKNHEKQSGDGNAALPIVAIQVVMPPIGEGDQLPQVKEDQMGGVPAYVEGEVLEEQP